MEVNEQKPIPIDFITAHTKAMNTVARRKPFVELVAKWADRIGNPQLGKWFQSEVGGGQIIDAEHMPKDFMPYYRQPEVAARLIEIVRAVDVKISSGTERWTWAHVMRVMYDEGIIFKITVNRFDSVITSMIPGKGKDNVRHHGDYTIMNKEEGWPLWTKTSYQNPVEAENRTVCDMIAMEFVPVLKRKVTQDY